MVTPPFLPDETKPADGDIVSQYPAVERLFRDIIESWLLIDHDTDGKHTQVTLPELAVDPTAVTNTGFLYTKDDAGDTELYYRDDSGNIVQMTADGGAGFPATTSMLFYQSAAPTGWTKDVAATLDKHGIEVVTSTAWAGGSNGATAFDTVFGPAKGTGGHTLAESEIPAHTHATQFRNDSTSGGTTPYSSLSTTGGALVDTDSTGGGGSHNHTLSLDLNFIKVIRATKD